MPKNKMTKKLVEAFNFDNRFYRIIDTNLILESRWNGDFIVIKFDKNMNAEQCVSYMNDFKNKVVERFYETEKGAGIAFDIESFPFNLGKGKLQPSKKGMRYVAPIEDGTIFNLKCYLISSFASNIEEELGEIFGVGYLEDLTRSMKFDRRHYLYCTDFRDKEVRDKFIELFRSEIESHNNVSSSLLKVEGNCVYVKDIFKNNIPLIDSMIERNLWLMGRHLQVPSNEDEYVEAIKDKITDLVHVKSSIPIYIIFHASYLGSKDNSVLIPVVQSFDGSFRSLTQKEAKNINKVFGYSVLHNVDDCITKKQLTELLGEGYKKGVYGINFYDKEISYCVLSKIMESSVINKDHELAIDPELPRKLLTEPSLKQESPTRSQGVGLGESPRQGLEESFMLHKKLDVPGTSGEFLPRSHLSYTAVSQGTEKCVSAAQNVQAGPSTWSQPMNPLLSQSTSGNKWTSSTQFTQPGPSGLSWTQSRPSSSKGADESMPIEIRDQQVRYRPSLTPFPTAWDDSTFLNPEVSNEEPEKQQVTKEEEKLFKALLYWFNLNNYALDPPHTNFIAENGKIASFIDDGVDVKEYLQEIIDKTKEEYRVNKEEAYDLNEFPFKFLSSCEENQETTVVANISRGALLNLKELFSQEHEGKVEIKDIDINIVEKYVKSKKDEWVNSQVREHGLSPKKAITTCYPDESVLEYISITKDEGGYWINRDYDGSEVESFRKEQWPAKGISKAEKMKPEDNKDSGYSSGFVTDAENVSSKAEATTSGYESMDCENTGRRLLKRRSQSPVGEGNSTNKFPKSGSSSSSSEEEAGSPHSNFSDSDSEGLCKKLHKTGISK
ncbi:hypothetical protein [Wolbachia endosymbiont (group A) of Gymnosoma rotundatum]|uniref:hypothetical protein n=1 Tax=Wolbachia endosymbiont (group A) of Gymnosoma rotundatum TaxID=2954016 RepID=UPI002227A326|nr:hypothetical protein [Wolbachia endosymbiont (group A) of Gymnosoma rotundatum]